MAGEFGMEQFEKTVYHHFSAGAGGSSLILSVFDGESEPYQADLRAFGKQKVTFGRSEENDIVLRSKLVSRRHGEFFIHGDACVLLDSGSTNGLTVNGARVREHALQEGDHIRIDDLASPSQLGVLLLFATAPETLAWQSCPVREQQEITIGRDPSCDIQLPHVSVSRLHASILREGNEFFIVDRGSTNGLTVNGAPVRQKQLLRERDVILITNSKLVFSRNVIRYCCYTGGIGVDASHIVKRVPAKDGEKTISNDISLSIKPCELVAIIGGSGAGKTTFMNCLSGSVPATEGHVYVNGEDLYANYGTLKSVIGYVPQQDIVYGELSLWDMLEYAAKLRMPVDTSPAERAARIHSVIGTVELTGNEGTLIRQLSGGQRKRASIAVELLSDPGLFFLDEPTSGLDPGIERSLMKTLRGMSRQGKTIVLVTHNIQNLHLCDQVIILGYGGVLCYCGAPDEALRFFGTDNLVDVYNMVSAQPEDWRGRFAAAAAAPAAQMPAAAPARAGGGRGERRPFFYQLGVLCARYLRLIGNDRQKLLILLLQAPLLAALIALVANGTQFEQYETTKSLQIGRAHV